MALRCSSTDPPVLLREGTPVSVAVNASGQGVGPPSPVQGARLVEPMLSGSSSVVESVNPSYAAGRAGRGGGNANPTILPEEDPRAFLVEMAGLARHRPNALVATNLPVFPSPFAEHDP